MQELNQNLSVNKQKKYNLVTSLAMPAFDKKTEMVSLQKIAFKILLLNLYLFYLLINLKTNLQKILNKYVEYICIYCLFHAELKGNILLSR